MATSSRLVAAGALHNGASVTLVTFGDFGVSFRAAVAVLYTRRGGPRILVRGWTQLVPTRGPLYLPCNAAPQRLVLLLTLLSHS